MSAKPTLPDPNEPSVLGPRFRMQRLRDARMFAGWMVGFDGRFAHVIPLEEPTAVPGEEFFCEAFLDGYVLAFRAASFSKGAGRIGLELTESPRRLPSTESMRVQTPGRTALLSTSVGDFEADLVDVGTGGAAVHAPIQLQLSDPVKIAFETGAATIEAEGTVRYCRLADPEGVLRRIGIRVHELDRTTAARWRALLRQVA